MSRRKAGILLAFFLVVSCRRAAPAPAPAKVEFWPVTAWGSTFEVFFVTPAMVAGQTAHSHAHVTVLQNSSPLHGGAVTLVLRDPSGGEVVSERIGPKRDGIFIFDPVPPREGPHDLFFRVESAGGSEEIPGGRVRVGSRGAPGAVLERPAHGPGFGSAAAEGASGAVSFVKELQWHTEFQTEWAAAGSLRESVSAPGRVVKSRPLLLEVALIPEDAPKLAAGPLAGLLLRRSPSAPEISIQSGDLGSVSLSTELDPRTSSILASVELRRAVPELPTGTSFDAELLLPAERTGIVIPDTALVAESSVMTVYEQVEGESFARREVRVIQKQGGRVLVEGLLPGSRIVTKGGTSIRRASLLSSGAPEGHVH
jgi:hypothetical protein